MKSIRLENVKAFVDTKDIEIAPITIFVGRNSCGKSSFIRFPQVLAQTFANGMNTPIYLYGNQEDTVDYGTFKEVLHNGDGNSFSVSLSYPFDYAIARSMRRRISSSVRNSSIVNLKNVNEISIRITYSIPEKRVYATKIELFVNGMEFSSFTKVGGTKEYVFSQSRTIKDGELKGVDYSYHIKSMLIQNYMPAFSQIEFAEAICRKYKSEDGPVSYDYLVQILDARNISESEVNTNDEQWMVEAKNAFEASVISSNLFTYVYELMQREFLQLKYIGPFRSAPKRYYRVDEIERDEVGVQGDYTSSLLINSDDDLRSEVSSWFEEAFGSEIRVTPVGEGTGLYAISAVDLNASDKNNGREIGSNLMDVGYGFSQVLPIVTQLKKTQIDGKGKSGKHLYPYSEIVVIEQPELHLHPAAQSKLASLFADSVYNGSTVSNRKLMIETHSEHLIRALQYLIASPESRLNKDMVKIYYIDKTDSSGSTINEMEINDFGQLTERWPKGFFDEAQIMSRKLMDAIAERKSVEE